LELPVRVYYEDTDAAGVVYYARYLGFMERARTEWLRALGIEQQTLAQQENIIFAVTRVEVDYRRPARLDDLLTVTAQVAKRRRVGLTFHQEIRRREGGELLCSGKVSVVCLDAARLRPRALPYYLNDGD
jgi:acyl-CoA thioester hydrolase